MTKNLSYKIFKQNLKKTLFIIKNNNLHVIYRIKWRSFCGIKRLGAVRVEDRHRRYSDHVYSVHPLERGGALSAQGGEVIGETDTREH